MVKIHLLSTVVLCGALFGCGGSGSSELDAGLTAGLDTGERSTASLASVIAAPSQTLPVADTHCQEFIEGIPLGMACLHCAAPAAREQVLRIADLMARSCRRNLATTMLVDGTFGDDRDFLGEVVRILTERGSRLHLYLYLANGPWQRRYDRVPEKGFGTKMPPEEFRERILHDPELQEAFRARVRWVEPLLGFAQSRGAIVYLIPSLEDNLTAASARAMEELVLQTINPQFFFGLGRNPCPGCYPGNDASTAQGIFLDQHVHSIHDAVHSQGGLVTNDGVGMTFPWEPVSSASFIPYEELRLMITQAAAQNSSFVIWRREYQGLEEDGLFRDPAERNYEMPNQTQESALLGLLTHAY